MTHTTQLTSLAFVVVLLSLLGSLAQGSSAPSTTANHARYRLVDLGTFGGRSALFRFSNAAPSTVLAAWSAEPIPPFPIPTFPTVFLAPIVLCTTRSSGSTVF